MSHYSRKLVALTMFSKNIYTTKSLFKSLFAAFPYIYAVSFWFYMSDRISISFHIDATLTLLMFPSFCFCEFESLSLSWKLWTVFHDIPVCDIGRTWMCPMSFHLCKWPIASWHFLGDPVGFDARSSVFLPGWLASAGFVRMPPVREGQRVAKPWKWAIMI